MRTEKQEKMEASNMKRYYINQWNQKSYRHNRRRNIRKAGRYSRPICISPLVATPVATYCA
ncbi:hypothetical protein [Selenomonas sp.]|uniref:hypothetical protein n=1 Tax=Selenomonas sp. TaxID=2053611 RepID=UPI0025FE3F84|nr:hypothetical protein [Selenomonas sp.]